MMKDASLLEYYWASTNIFGPKMLNFAVHWTKRRKEIQQTLISYDVNLAVI